jgi:hypothetical protein
MNIDSLAHLLRGLKLAGNDEVNGRDEIDGAKQTSPGLGKCYNRLGRSTRLTLGLYVDRRVAGWLACV